jgi:uncharacterized protein (DUF1778 family)
MSKTTLVQVNYKESDLAIIEQAAKIRGIARNQSVKQSSLIDARKVVREFKQAQG